MAKNKGKELVPQPKREISPVAVGMARMLEIIEDDKALDALTDENLANLEIGTPEEKLGKCQNILLMAQAGSKMNEKISIVAGAAFLEIERELLWKVARRDDGTGYKNYTEFLTDKYPYFRPARVSQMIDAFRYAKKYRTRYEQERLPMPKSETDCRVPLATQRKIEKHLVEELGMTRQAAIAMAEDAAIDVVRIATAEKASAQPDKAKTDPKPSYGQLIDAQDVVYQRFGLAKTKDDPTTSANQGTPAPAPEEKAERMPEAVDPDVRRALTSMSNALASALQNAKMDTAAIYMNMTAGNLETLRKHCGKVLLVVAEFDRSLGQHVRPGTTVKGQKVDGSKVQHAPSK